MNELLAAITRLLQTVQPWITVSPWEQVLRVRCGRWIRLLQGGIYIKIPILDVLYQQSIRLRLCSIGKQNATTTDGRTITLCGSAAYCITDLLKLYNTLHHAEDTITNIVRVRLAEYIAAHDLDACAPDKMAEAVTETVAPELEQYGLGSIKVMVTDFAVVRTYRVIGDYASVSSVGGMLDTEGRRTSN